MCCSRRYRQHIDANSDKAHKPTFICATIWGKRRMMNICIFPYIYIYIGDFADGKFLRVKGNNLNLITFHVLYIHAWKPF